MSAGERLAKWTARNFPEHSRDKAEKQRLSNLKTCVRKLVSEHEWTTDQIVMAVIEAIIDVSNLPVDRYDQEWQS